MPEGDTLARIASHSRRFSSNGAASSAARGQPGGAQLERVVGQQVESVESRGKHLLVAFDGGMTLHTHLGLHGSWHRYRARSRGDARPSRAVAVLETSDWVAVCFDAPTVELMDTRAVDLHPALRRLGSDLAATMSTSIPRLRHCAIRLGPTWLSATRCSTSAPSPGWATSIAASCASSSGSTRSRRCQTCPTSRCAGCSYAARRWSRPTAPAAHG